MNKEIPKPIEPKPETNNVHFDKFESKMDDFFTSKSKEKDHSQRRCSIKLYGQWT